MEEVIAIFNERNEMYQQYMNAILEKMPYVVEGIIQSLQEKANIIAQGAFLEILDLALAHDKGQKLLVISGFIRFPEGDYVLGTPAVPNPVTITKDNKEYFDTVFQYFLKWEVVEQQSTDAIKKSMMEMFNAQQAELDVVAEVKEVLANAEGSIDVVDWDKMSQKDRTNLLEKISPVAKGKTHTIEGSWGFDLDDLTEEQRVSLDLFNKLK